MDDAVVSGTAGKQKPLRRVPRGRNDVPPRERGGFAPNGHGWLDVDMGWIARGVLAAAAAWLGTVAPASAAYRDVRITGARCVQLDEAGQAGIEHAVSYRVVAGTLAGVDLTGIEPSAIVESGATVTADGRAIEAHAARRRRSRGGGRGDPRGDLEPKGLRRGNYTVKLRYHVDLRRAARSRARAMWRPRGPRPRCRRIDSERVVFDLPAAPTEPSAWRVDADEMVASEALVARRASSCRRCVARRSATSSSWCASTCARRGRDLDGAWIPRPSLRCGADARVPPPAVPRCAPPIAPCGRSRRWSPPRSSRWSSRRAAAPVPRRRARSFRSAHGPRRPRGPRGGGRRGAPVRRGGRLGHAPRRGRDARRGAPAVRGQGQAPRSRPLDDAAGERGVRRRPRSRRSAGRVDRAREGGGAGGGFADRRGRGGDAGRARRPRGVAGGARRVAPRAGSSSRAPRPTRRPIRLGPRSLLRPLFGALKKHAASLRVVPWARVPTGTDARRAAPPGRAAREHVGLLGIEVGVASSPEVLVPRARREAPPRPACCRWRRRRPCPGGSWTSAWCACSPSCRRRSAMRADPPPVRRVRRPPRRLGRRGLGRSERRLPPKERIAELRASVA